jgi:7-cyano-7-deazaguanine synthase in queuosine biosynthesis
VKRSVILYTGGMDSLILSWLRPDAELVYVSIGSTYEYDELAACLRMAEQGLARMPTIIDGGTLLAQEADGHVLHRNLVLIAHAAAMTGADEVLLGAVRGEASLDKSARFLRRAGRVLSASEGRRVRVRAPLKRDTKAGWVGTFLREGGSRQALMEAVSCYAGEGWSCGECQACFRRWVALTLNGIDADFASDPRTYASGLRWQDGVRAILRAPVREWYGMAVNNFGAWQVLRQRA